MLVLDANILVRAVLGTRVRNLLGKYGDGFDFAAPDVAFQEAEEHLPQVLKARNLTPDPFMSFFASLVNTIQAIDREAYSAFETVARQRLTKRDEEDWPVLATALRWIVRSGPKTPISSAAAWRYGQQTAWSCTCRSLRKKTKQVALAPRYNARRPLGRVCLRLRGWNSSSSARISGRRLFLPLLLPRAGRRLETRRAAFPLLRL